jgi:ligand-binding sensor domain-containing protein
MASYSSDPSSLANNKVRALLEDSKSNFWVGTAAMACT